MRLLILKNYRIGSGEKLQAMIMLSLLIHAIVLSLFFIVKSSVSTPKWTFGPIYSVQLVNMSGKALTTSASAEISKDILKPDTTNQNIVLKKSIDALRPSQPAPIRATEIPKKDRSEVERAIANLRNRIAAAGESPKTADQTAPRSGGGGEFNRQANAYFNIIEAKTKGQWAFPKELLKGEKTFAIVSVRILRSGDIADLGIEKRSGNRYFDESALRAVRKAAPFPPLPEVIRDSSLEMGIRFHSSELAR